VGRPDADQPFESTFSQQSALIPNISKFLTIRCSWDEGKTLKEVVRVLTFNQPLDPDQVLAHLLRILKAAKVGIVFTF